MSDPRELPPGLLIRGRYRVERALGRGSFGAAYRATDLERFDAPRAIKRLHPGHRGAARAASLFEREARTLAAIDHPLVPRLHHYFEFEGDFYLVEDFVEGETWDRVLARRGPLPEVEVGAAAADVLDVLVALHGRDPAVIHRDIKPSNLIRRVADGRTVVIDFGAVREVVEQEDPGTVIGSVGYAPKEQASGRPTPASDLYALGATMVHLLTRKPPNAWHHPESGAVDIAGRLPVSAPMAALIEDLFCDRDCRIQTAVEAARRLTVVNDGGARRATVGSGLAHPATPNAAAPPSQPLATSFATPAPLAAHTIDLGAAPPRAAVARAGRSRALPAQSFWRRPATLLGGFLALVAVAYAAVVGASRSDRSSEPSVNAAADSATVGAAWTRSDLLTASGIPLWVRHPPGWRAKQARAGAPAYARHGTTTLRVAPGSLLLELPDSAGVVLVGLDSFADPVLPVDRFLDDWSHALGAIRHMPARPVRDGVYQATLTSASGATDGVGLVHTVFARERTGTRVLWRAFVGDARAREAAMRIVLDSLHVDGG